MSRRTAARERVIGAVLRVLTAEHDDNPHAYSDAKAELADEQLALAARELAVATDQLPPDERPVGWGDAVTPQAGVIGFMVVERSAIPSEPPVANWDGEIHPSRARAEAECRSANTAGSEPDDTPDDAWRVVAVVEVAALVGAEQKESA